MGRGGVLPGARLCRWCAAYGAGADGADCGAPWRRAWYGAAWGAWLRMPHVPFGLDGEGHCVCPVRRAPRTPRRRPRTAPAPYAARHLRKRTPCPLPRRTVRSAPRAQPGRPVARVRQPGDASRRTLPIR
ncbi:hypothetical protein MTP02_12640 [Streptomyces albus]|nr:hypothetical protein MTP02_12640 [Streptomyces albus]